MSNIRIKNFGPIKDGCIENDGWMEVKKVTVFIGNQGSGKSTVAKTISTLSWLEKSINRGDIHMEISSAKFKEFFQYQKIHNYFLINTFIEYIGDAYHILYDTSKENPIIKKMDANAYVVPQIIYIPAERNFLSTISDAYNVKGLPENVFTFAEELRKAQKELNGKKLLLPIGNYSYEYDENKDSSFVLGPDYRINLLEASSGLQSFIPLFLVSKNLSTSISENSEMINRNLTVNQALRMADEIMNLMQDNSLNQVEKNKNVSIVKARYFNKCFHNIVEEPEQNLFPNSQQQMLNTLLEFNNRNTDNKLIITTHSPYLINYLSIAIQGSYLLDEINKKGESKKLIERFNAVVPINSIVSAYDVIVYQLDVNNGTITKLSNYEGIPSDRNYLNPSLQQSNEIFDSLLEMEQGL